MKTKRFTWKPGDVKIKKKKSLKKSDEGDNWSLDVGDRERLRNGMSKEARAIIAAILAIGEDEMFSMALEGGRFAGGITTSEAAVIAKAAVQFNKEHAAGFEEDMLSKIDDLVDGTYLTEDDFISACESSFDSFSTRAESYASAGGKQAWGKGVSRGAVNAGMPGGFWNCTFGPGSCTDCLSLHGQWMTIDEFENTYQQTICDGGCNCGFVPAENPESILPEDLNIPEEDAA